MFQTEKEILLLNKPRIWNIHVDGNMEVEMEVSFDKFLLNISEHTNEDLDKISTFRFFVLIDYIKEKIRNNGRSNNKL